MSGDSDEIELQPGLASKAASAAGAAGVDAASVEAAAGAQASAASEASAAVSSSAEIARALAAGELDAVAARQQLIEAVISEQFGELEGATRARLEAEIGALLEDDPTLGRYLRVV